MKVAYKYWTKSQGIGGMLLEPEDFVVKEILHPDLLRKSASGKYTLFLVRKRNMTTHQMIEKLRSMGLLDIGYAGLKDKFAVTWQYVSAITAAREYKSGDVHALPMGSSRKLMPGDLVANAFVITLHGCKTAGLTKVVDELAEKGMPNYFGLQRFGKYRNNHIIGRHLVKKQFGKALDLINLGAKREYASIKGVPKQQLKFFINAYQSWIFNEALNRYIGKNRKPHFKGAAIIGYESRLGNSAMDAMTKAICREERVSAKDFRISELMLACHGSRRSAFVTAGDVDYAVGNGVKLAFTLPKGSYATILLSEVCKAGFRLNDLS